MYISYLAAFHGDLPLLQELLADSQTDPKIIRLAVRGGQLETLQWLITQKGCELNRFVFSEACKGGNLEVLKWLRREGCPWNEWTCNYAARGGHLDVLKWAIDNGCPYKVNRYNRKAFR